jgi:hypothetical protein
MNVLAHVLERRLREVSQRALFSDVEHCVRDIASSTIECTSLQEIAKTLDYDAIGDPRVESQYAA